jgi:hypothetical protein
VYVFVRIINIIELLHNSGKNYFETLFEKYDFLPIPKISTKYRYMENISGSDVLTLPLISQSVDYMRESTSKTKLKKRNPTSQTEKRGLGIQSMTLPLVKGYFIKPNKP